MRSDSTTAGKLLQETLETEPEFCLGVCIISLLLKDLITCHTIRTDFGSSLAVSRGSQRCCFLSIPYASTLRMSLLVFFASDCPKVRLITWVSVIRIFLSSTTETQVFQNPPGFPCSFMKFHLVVTYKSNHNILLPDTPVLVEWAHE